MTKEESRALSDQMKTISSPGRAKKPSLEKIKARLVECRRSQRLNFSSLEIIEFPPKFVSQASAAGVNTIFELDLHSNHISVLPLELTEFRTLRVLRLDYNCFHEIPKVVFTFIKLQILSMSNNEVKEIDIALQDLVFLHEIDFSNNCLTSLPEFWTSMSSLVNLNLGSNKLSSIPLSLGGIKGLQYLDLSHNSITSLPQTLQNLQELVSLNVFGNKITVLPTTLSHLKMLQKLECGDNPLEEPGRSIALQGFENYMGYLRTSFEEEQIREWEKSRPMPSFTGIFHKFVTRCELGNWPVARAGHTICQVQTKTFIFGGFIKKYGKVDELLVIDSRTMRWSRPTTNGCPPSPRDNHCVAFDHKDRLYFFGGRNDEHKLLNDIHYLDLQSMSWTKPVIDGNLPTIREGASMVVVGDKIVLFGGHGAQQLYNDINILDTKKWIWTPQSTKGLRPCPRKFFAMVVDDTTIYIQGGRDKLVYDDMFALHITDFTWHSVLQEGLKPRYGHVAALQEKMLYMIGGFNSSGSIENSLYGLSLHQAECKLPILNQCATLTIAQRRAFNITQENSFKKWCKNHKTEIIDNDVLYWSELDCAFNADLPQTFAFHENKLIVIKEDDEVLDGSALSSSMTTRQPSTYWHIYMQVELESLQIKVSTKAIREQAYNKTNRILHKKCNSTKMPKSFQKSSSIEEKLMAHVRKFSKCFMQEYPERRPLTLIALNECGVHKLICNLIRPSQTIHPEFYNWDGLTNFLSKYLDYEPLESPTTWPSYIPSPSSVIEWSRGDCFDFSVALVSLLIGVGYNALCVVGYAPIQITRNDQMLNFCVRDVDDQGGSTQSMPNQPVGTQARQRYKQRSHPVLSASYLANLRRSRWALLGEFVQDFLGSHEDVLTYGRTDEQDILLNFINERLSPHHVPNTNKSIQIAVDDLSRMEPKGNDLLGKRRLHCWVMICSGKREVVDSFFVEPTTGYHFSLLDAPYLGVELVFSHQNAWINLQCTSHGKSLENMSWDFMDASRWEKILDSYQSNMNQNSTKFEESSTGAMTSTNTHLSSKLDSPSTTLAHVKAFEEEGSDDGSKINQEGHGKTEIIKQTRGRIKGQGGSPSKASTSSAIKTSKEDTAAYQWLLPLSCVPKLIIPMDAFVTRFRLGVKKTILHRCEHIMYATYGEHMRWDGLLERILFFADDHRTHLVECHDYFQRRQDKLKRRIFFRDENKMQEIFGLGTPSGVKEILTIEGVSQHFLFYPRSRVDGLLQREEILGKKLIEEFDGIEGNMISRSAQYACEATYIPKDALLLSQRDETLGDTKQVGSIEKCNSNNWIGKHEKKSKNRERCYMEFSSTKSGGRQKYSPNLRQGGIPEDKETSGIQIFQSRYQKSPSLYSSRLRRPAHVLLPISQITQRYLKPSDNCLKPAIKETISKYDSSQVQVNFHYIGGNITCISRVYEKDGTYHVLHMDPFQPTIEEFERMDEFRKLTTAERESMQGIREAELETHKIREQRAYEEQNVVILKPFPDIGKYTADEFKDEEDMTKVENDYLSSFFPMSIYPRQHLTRPQMIIVRDNCLRALKERFMRRANIIKSRLESESAALSKKRASFERDREGMTVSEEEEYEASCAKASFRIRILQQRQKYHEDKTLQRYGEMEKKLQSDPRFLKLYEGYT